MRKFVLILAFAATPVVAGAQASSAGRAASDAAARVGADAAALEGKPVLGAKGAILGHVERVTVTPDGKPGQILVRPKGLAAGGPRSIAFAAVQITRKGVQTPLSRAEFAAMPAVIGGR